MYVCLGLSLAWSTPRDLTLAKKYYKDEVYSASAEHYRKYLAGSPEKDEIPKARIGLARSLTKLFEYEKSSQVYQDFLLSYPLHKLTKHALYERADVLTKLNQPGLASDLFYKFSQLDKTVLSHKALYKAAQFSFTAKDFESSKGYAQQYLEKHSQGKEAPMCIALIGRVAFRESNWGDAIKYLNEAIEKGVSEKIKRKATLLIARAYSKLGNTPETVKYYKTILAVADSSDSLKLIHEYSGYLYKAAEYRTLIEFLDSKSLEQLNEKTGYRLLSALVETKNYSVAQTTLKVLVFKKPKLVIQTRYLSAKILLGLGEPGEGIAVLYALGKDGHPDAFELAGDAYLSDAMYQNAIQSYYLAADKVADDQRKSLLLKIGDIYEKKLYRFKVAISVYEDFVQNYPSDPAAPKAALGVARCYLSEDKLKEASYEYRKVIEDYPSSVEAIEAGKRYDYLNTFKLRDRDAALNHILLIMERGEYEEKLLHVARVYEEDLKEYERALKSYKRYIKLYPQGAKQDYAWLKKGEMHELLATNARYEMRSNRITEQVNKARESYTHIGKNFQKSNYADDAEFHLLELGTFNLSQYQEFVNKYPKSNFTPHALFAIGETYLKQAEDFGGAIGLKSAEYFQQILNSFSKSGFRNKALLGVSRSYYLTDEYKKARPTLNLLLKEGVLPKEIESEALYYSGLVYMKEHQYSQAIKQFKKVQYRFFSTAAAEKSQLMIARSYGLNNDILSAKQSYSAYIQRFSYSDSIFVAYTGLMSIHEKEMQWRKAAGIYTDFVTTLPEHPRVPDALEKRGKLLQLVGEKRDAATSFITAIEKSKGLKDYLYYQVAEMMMLLDDFKRAETYYISALGAAQNSRDSSRAMGGKVACLAMLGNTNQYHVDYKLYKNSYDIDDEGHARIFYYSGRSYMDQHKRDKAKKRFEYLSEKFDETSWAGEGMYYLGIIAFKKGKFTEALNIFKEYVKEYPEGKSKSDVVFKMATCYYQQKNYLKAAELYRKVLANPEVPETTKYRAAYNAAIANEKSSQWTKAAYMYDILLKDFAELSQNTSLYVSAGFCWYNAKEYVKAKDLFKRSLDDPESERKEEAHYWYAKMLDHIGNVEEAVKEYYKVNYLYAGAGMWALTALFDIGQIYERSGDIERARKMYQKIVDRDGKSGSLGSRAYQYLQDMDKRYGPKSS